jgi:Right handed beta helix region
MRVLRENRRVTLLATLTSLALVVSFAVVSTQSSSGALSRTLAPGTSMHVECQGTSLTTTATSATAMNLDCLTRAPEVPVEVGHPTTFESGSSGSPSTALPAGTAVGDVLVSYIESYSFTSISCRTGWSLVLDTASTGGARLVACSTVVGSSGAVPEAVLDPPTQVSMVTVAFSGVSTTNPIDASAASAGAVSPSVTTDTAGTALLLGEGSDMWGFAAQAPRGANLGATINDEGNSQVAIATTSEATSGPTAPASWPYVISPDAVSAAIALRPATTSSDVTSPTTQGSDSETVQMAANTSMTAFCEGYSMTVTGTSPTAATLECLAARPIAQVGRATTFSSGSSGSPSTSLPSGVGAGDFVVSYIESYAFTSISCDSGWTETIDVENGPDGARLAACDTIASVDQNAPLAHVDPPTQVSMVTVAFSGVSVDRPIDASAARPGLVSPAVTTSTPGTTLVLGEGNNAWNLVSTAPAGAVLGATINDLGNSQVAVATVAGVDAGQDSPNAWTPSVSGSAPDAATIALRPVGGTTTTTTTSDPTTTTTGPTTTTTGPTTTTTGPTTTTTGPTTTTTGPTTTTTSGGGSGPPTSPPVEICGNETVLTGPSSAPSGAVTVPAGDNSNFNFETANTTYWFAPGIHTLGTGVFSQIIPSNGDTYVGGPGAIIDGQNLNDYAFTQNASNVTVEYLTIENFGQTGGNENQGVVNHNSASNWTIQYNTIQDNAGAGIMMGSNDLVQYNCLTKNGQYGFSSYTVTGPSNITLSHNEVSYNDTYNWEQKDPGCGCSGGGKFWDTNGATVTDNYIHNNANVGVWADTDNANFNIAGNYISDNYGEGVMYEISYNARIADNTFIRNAIGEGPTNPSFPTGAIYISESGSNSGVAGPYSNTFEITDNAFEDNWSGVVLWENSNRFCGPDSPDNAGSLCTLVDPSVANATTCVTPGIDTEPLITDCRWLTENVAVTDNTFDFNPSDIGSDCTEANGCGFNGIFSEYGTTPPYTGWMVPRNIADNQNNHFTDNTYTGPWSFMGPDMGTDATWSQWTSGFTDNSDGSGIHFDPQDAGSTMNN